MPLAQRRAFTLIELLVVIAIIALLLAILLPSLGAAREHTRGVVCRTHMAELGRCEVLYAGDYGSFSPCIDNYHVSGWDTNRPGLDWLGIGDQFGSFVPGNEADPWTGNPKGYSAAPRFGLLWRYMQNPDLIKCPSDLPGTWVPNQLVGAGIAKFSYTMVAVMGLRNPEKVPGDHGHFQTENINPCNAPVFVEEHSDGFVNHREGNFGASYPPGDNSGDILVSRHAPFSDRPGIAPGAGTTTIFRQGSSNIAFADGHCEPIQPNFGHTRAHAMQPGYTGIPNTSVGLLYHYGIKYELLELE